VPESVLHVDDTEDTLSVQFRSYVRKRGNDEMFAFDCAIEVGRIQADA